AASSLISRSAAAASPASYAFCRRACRSATSARTSATSDCPATRQTLPCDEHVFQHPPVWAPRMRGQDEPPTATGEGRQGGPTGPAGWTAPAGPTSGPAPGETLPWIGAG